MATEAQQHKLNRDPIEDPHLILLEFQEDGQSAVERAVMNTEDYTWRDNLYYRSEIDIRLPISGNGQVRAELSASNVERLLGRALDAATQRINVRMILIDSAEPEPPLIDTENLLVIESASGNATEVSGQLGPRADLLEPVPFKKTTRADFPGVWLPG